MRGVRVIGALVLGGLIALTSCTRKKEVTGPDREVQALMPLTIGNSWTYKAYEVDAASGDTTWHGPFIYSITGTRKIDGQEYFVTEDGSLYRNRPDGLFTGLYDEGLRKFFDDMFFKFPVADGESYSFVSQEAGAEVKMKVTRGKCTVPAGSFEDVYVYEVQGPSPPSRFYFMPGVGLLKTENVDQPGQGIVLLSYKLTQP